MGGAGSCRADGVSGADGRGFNWKGCKNLKTATALPSSATVLRMAVIRTHLSIIIMRRGIRTVIFYLSEQGHQRRPCRTAQTRFNHDIYDARFRL